MGGSRRAGIVLLCAVMAGCGPQAQNEQVSPANLTIPVGQGDKVEATALADEGVDRSNLKNQDFPVPRETSTEAPLPRSRLNYRAIGTEPFWAVAVAAGIVTLTRPGKEMRQYAVSRNDDGREIRYLGDGFTMILTPGPCSDGMSDAIWSDRVQIAFGEGTLNGCGGEREDHIFEAEDGTDPAG